MRIGFLQCGHLDPKIAVDHGTYSDLYARLLDGHGFSFQTYDVVDMEFPDSVTDCDGWLLTGSKHGAYDDMPFIKPLEGFIRDAFSAHVPLVGICFGHQIVAQALGGRVEKFTGGWGVGLHDYTFEDLPPQKLNAWHQDQIVERPEGARVIASSPFCENAGLVYDTRALTIQPHPEFTGPFIRALADLRRGSGDYPDALISKAIESAEHANTNADMAGKIAQFFKTGTEARHG